MRWNRGRTVFSILEEHADQRFDYQIPNRSQQRVVVINIRGQPLVVVQDSKHALKTYRNNSFSGARCLLIGDHVALYEHILQVSRGEGTPLYQRDITKVDRHQGRHDGLVQQARLGTQPMWPWSWTWKQNRYSSIHIMRLSPN